jgi:hypothetical protein
MAAAPLGFILSLLGVIFNRDRMAAVLGLIISGAMVALFLLVTLCV